MEGTDWKEQASKTFLRKLKPLRNCTALSSKIRVQQEEQAEWRTSHLRTHRPRPSARAVAELCRYRSWGISSYLEASCYFTSFLKKKLLISWEEPKPFWAHFLAPEAAGASTGTRWLKPELNLFSEESWPWLNAHSSFWSPGLAAAGEHPHHLLSFLHL